MQFAYHRPSNSRYFLPLNQSLTHGNRVFRKACATLILSRDRERIPRRCSSRSAPHRAPIMTQKPTLVGLLWLRRIAGTGQVLPHNGPNRRSSADRWSSCSPPCRIWPSRIQGRDHVPAKIDVVHSEAPKRRPLIVLFCLGPAHATSIWRIMAKGGSRLDRL
jgi:hypothetical protein